MNGNANIRWKWLAGAMLAVASGGCITYSGDYANDGYYSSPDRGNAYHDGYYGDYYYSAVPTINISYNLFFGYPLYGYGGCGYWSPYCGMLYPAYGYGYGVGWGHPPYYGYQPHPPYKPKPKPPHNTPSAPDPQDGQPIVKRPIRALPGYMARPTRSQTSQAATPPVSTGAPSESATDATPITAYRRAPANDGRGLTAAERDAIPVRSVRAQPEIPSPQPIGRQFVRLDTDEAPATRAPSRDAAPAISASRPAPAIEPSPARPPPPAVREPKPVRDKPQRKATAAEDVDP